MLEQISQHYGLSTFWLFTNFWILEQIPQPIHQNFYKIFNIRNKNKEIIDQNDLKPSLAPTLRLQEKSTTNSPSNTGKADL